MKKILLIALSVLLFGMAAAVVFMLTFNVDSYRPFLIEKAQTAIGRPVKLDKISLGWAGGIALKLEGLSVLSDSTPEAEELVTFDSAYAIVSLWPFLERKIQVGSVLLRRPQVHVIRTRDGRLKGWETAQPVKSASKENPEAALALSFFIDAFHLEDGSIRFIDEDPASGINVEIHDIDLKIRGIALGQPIPVILKAGIFNPGQNLSLNGSLFIAPKNFEASLKNIRFETDLGAIRYDELIKSVPAMRAMGPDGKISGRLTATVGQVSFSPNGNSNLEAMIRLDQGGLDLKGMPNSVQAIQAEVDLQNEHLEISKLTAQFAGGQFQASAVINSMVTRPFGDFQAGVSDLDAGILFPAAKAGDPQVEGKISGTLRGTFSGQNWPEISRNLKGQGHISLKDVVVRNLNILRDIFERISVIPGFASKMQQRLPARYQQKLKERDTVIEPADIPVSIGSGVLAASPVRIVTDTYQIAGTAQVGLDGRVSAQSLLTITSDLSDAMIRTINELSYLANERQELQIPVNASGTIPEVRVMPDIQYIASRVAISKTAELVSGFIQKDKSTQSGLGQSQGSTQEELSPLSSLLGELLKTQQKK